MLVFQGFAGMATPSLVGDWLKYILDPIIWPYFAGLI